MPDVHALLSASSSNRWLNCPPSARLCEKIPDTVSEYAAEGTLAHSICELKLTSYITPISKRSFNAKYNKLKKDNLWKNEMDGYTDVYVDYIKNLALSFDTKPGIFIEKQIDYSDYAPEGFGTSDCIIVHSEDLYIIDFKYGTGVSVNAEDNPQLKLYALGAVSIYSMFYPIKNIHLVIVQPRLDNISEWDLTRSDLIAWGEAIKPVARLAYEGKGEAQPGEHCKFCKVKNTCRKRAETNLALAKYQFAKPVQKAKDGEPVLDDNEIGDILLQAQDLKSWANDLEEYALKAVLEGIPIKGWKAVEGRGSRKWNGDTEALINRLKELNYPEEIIYTRKMLTAPQFEKEIGAKSFVEGFSDLIVKAKGKPTLVPESDKRPNYINGTTANEDFK